MEKNGYDTMKIQLRTKHFGFKVSENLQRKKQKTI
jgi:hypothetical protein